MRHNLNGFPCTEYCMTCICGFSKHLIFNAMKQHCWSGYHAYNIEKVNALCVFYHYSTILPHFKNRHIGLTGNSKWFPIMSVWVQYVSSKMDTWKPVEELSCLLTMATPSIALIGNNDQLTENNCIWFHLFRSNISLIIVTKLIIESLNYCFLNSQSLKVYEVV